MIGFFSFNKEVSLLVNSIQSWVLEVLTMLSFRYETLYDVEPRSLVLYKELRGNLSTSFRSFQEEICVFY